MKLAPSISYVVQGLASSGTLDFCRAHGLALANIGPVHNG